MPKTFRIHTLGCKVNQYESQNMRERLIAAGLREDSRRKMVNFIIINSCTVTAKADAETAYAIRRARRENKGALIAATGCMARFDAAALTAAGADLVVSNEKKHLIWPLVKRKPVPRQRGAYPCESISFFEGHSRAFLKIQDGCSHFCSYCKVPLVRGRPKSKPLGAVRAEAESLAANGYREIVLTGICLGAYGSDLPGRYSLADAVTELEGVPGLARIRLSSIELSYISPALKKKMSSSGKLCPHLHVPLQSGDSRILKAMRRHYTPGQFLATIKKIRSLVPGLAVSTDVLVGFPGETDRNFKNTLRVVDELEPLSVHVFPFSPRQGTPAAGMKNAFLEIEPIRQRIAALNQVASACGAAFRRGLSGKECDVLFERRVSGRWEGYTANYVPVSVQSNRMLTGLICRVQMTGEKKGRLTGRLSVSDQASNNRQNSGL